MNRGRVGYDLIGNAVQREREISMHFKVHKDRMEQIKVRQPEFIPPVTNLPPVNKKYAMDSRKKAREDMQNVLIERNNKVLLQRIGNILTAPPKLSDSYYIKMKGRMSGFKGAMEVQEEKMKDRDMKIFFDRVQKTKPTYSSKAFIEEYQHQLIVQKKFMRRVKYERPKGFKDPYAPEKASTAPEKSVALGGFDSTCREAGHSRLDAGGSSYVSSKQQQQPLNRLSRSTGTGSKSKRASSASHSMRRSTAGKSCTSSAKLSSLDQLQHGSMLESSFTESKTLEQTEGQYTDNEINEEMNRHYLAASKRMTKVTLREAPYVHSPKAGTSDAGSPGRQGSTNGLDLSESPVESSATFDIEADIRCWLLGKSVLALSAVTTGSTIPAVQSEIDLTQLDTAYMYNHSAAEVIGNEELLTALATDLVSFVEIFIEDEQPQLLVAFPTPVVETFSWMSLQPATEEEVQRMLAVAEARPFRRGVKMPLRISRPGQEPTVAEYIHAMLKMKRVGDDKVRIEWNVLSF